MFPRDGGAYQAQSDDGIRAASGSAATEAAPQRDVHSEDLIAGVMTVTLCSRDRAIAALDASAWNLHQAVEHALNSG